MTTFLVRAQCLVAPPRMGGLRMSNAEALTNFKTKPTNISGALIIDHKNYHDDRGNFYEMFHMEQFEKLGLPNKFVQANCSQSTFGVLRGLHIQKKNPQGKLLKCVVGEIYDVCVDLRPESPTFKRWFGTYLSGNDDTLLYLPEGTAHGFICTSGVCVVQYFCTTAYDKESDGGILWNDPEIGVEWPLEPQTLSDKDKNLPFLKDWLTKEK